MSRACNSRKPVFVLFQLERRAWFFIPYQRVEARWYHLKPAGRLELLPCLVPPDFGTGHNFPKESSTKVCLASFHLYSGLCTDRDDFTKLSMQWQRATLKPLCGVHYHFKSFQITLSWSPGTSLCLPNMAHVSSSDSRGRNSNNDPAH